MMEEYKYEFIIPVGPQHPALKEFELLEFVVEGEKIVEVIPRIGYNHRGIEKAFEDREWLKNVYLAERICGICGYNHTFVYVNGVEKILNLEIPRRAEYIRVIVAELERIHSHTLWLGVLGHEIGFDTILMYVWRDREIVMDLLELISGNRVNYGMNTIGGVRRDINGEKKDKLRKGMLKLRERVKYYKKLFMSEDTILKRIVDVGVLEHSKAKELLAVGPTLRGSGVKSDIRKDDPYSAYDEIPFNLISYDYCDVYSRTLVRIDETIESTKIILYALDHMPEGPISVKVPWRVKLPEGIYVSRGENVRGELLYYIESKGGFKPYRIKVKTPTLANIYPACYMLGKGVIADIPPVLGSIDPCFACEDRTTYVDKRRKKVWTWSWEKLIQHGTEYYGGR